MEPSSMVENTDNLRQLGWPTASQGWAAVTVSMRGFKNRGLKLIILVRQDRIQPNYNTIEIPALFKYWWPNRIISQGRLQ